MKYKTQAFWMKRVEDLSEADLWRKALHEPNEQLREQYEKRLHALWEALGTPRSSSSRPPQASRLKP